MIYIHQSRKFISPTKYNAEWQPIRPLRSDEPIHVGVIVVTHLGEIDDDDGIERFTAPGSVGYLKQRNHGPVWDLVFEHNGAWVCPDEAELRDPEQYTLYVKD